MKNVLKKTKSLISKYTGIVTFIEAIDKQLSDPDVFVVASQTANIQNYGYEFDVSSNGSGAGLTFDNAFNAALGEAIERYGLSIYEPEFNIISSYNDLIKKNKSTINPKVFQPYNYNKNKQLPYSEFNNDLPINWVKVQNLTKLNEELIPASIINIPYRPKVEGENVISFAVSTGAACSTSLKDAIIKGIFELIERDAFMIVWRNQLKIPRVHLNHDSKLFKLFQDVFDRPGLKYEIFYTTLDLGIPSFFGMLTDNRDDNFGRVVGGAAHSNPEVAFLKTLLELVQGLKWKDYKKEKLQNGFEVINNFENINSFEKRMELYSFNKETDVAFNFLKDVDTINFCDILPVFEDDIYNELIAVLSKKGMDVLAVDITPHEATECGLFVSKVIIPGIEIMEGDFNYPFLYSNRWREVPKDLGLKKEYTSFENINPFPHPYP
jgi:ribosomal protein S12 methylthiotransferase accessory factor